MTTRSHFVPLAAVFALTSLSVMVAAPQQPDRAGALDGPARVHGAAVNGASAQNAPSRSNDRVGELLTRTKKSADRFRGSLDSALNRSPINGSREEDAINQSVEDFAEATNHLSDHFDRRQVVTNDVEEVLRRGVNIDSFMQRHQLAMQAENDWRTVRRDLDELARVYNVAWNWSILVTPRSSRNRVSIRDSPGRTSWSEAGATIRVRQSSKRHGRCPRTSGKEPTSAA